MTSTEINDIGQLPMKVKKAFSDSEFGDAQVIDICKTEREEIEQPLYMLHFQYKWKDVEKVEHYVFINCDGMFLTTLTWTPNSQRWFVGLPKDHFDFIAKKYAGAQIRGYINNAGEHDHNLKDEKALQSYFIHFVQKVVNKKGKTLIGWDEILEGGISEDCVVMNWRRPDYGVKALKTGHHTIFTCYCFISPLKYKFQ